MLRRGSAWCARAVVKSPPCAQTKPAGSADDSGAGRDQSPLRNEAAAHDDSKLRGVDGTISSVHALLPHPCQSRRSGSNTPHSPATRSGGFAGSATYPGEPAKLFGPGTVRVIDEAGCRASRSLAHGNRHSARASTQTGRPGRPPLGWWATAWTSEPENAPSPIIAWVSVSRTTRTQPGRGGFKCFARAGLDARFPEPAKIKSSAL